MAKRTFTKYPSSYVKASHTGRNSDRFTFKVYTSSDYAYEECDEIMEEIDNQCDGVTSEVYAQFFCVEGPWEEKYTVARILDDFGEDYEEL